MNDIYGCDCLALSGRQFFAVRNPGRRRYAPLPWAVMLRPFRAFERVPERHASYFISVFLKIYRSYRIVFSYILGSYENAFMRLLLCSVKSVYVKKERRGSGYALS